MCQEPRRGYPFHVGGVYRGERAAQSLAGRRLRSSPRLIDFAQHFIAVVLDEQNLILGEWSMHINACHQVFTCTGKFMHILFEVHETLPLCSWRKR